MPVMPLATLLAVWEEDWNQQQGGQQQEGFRRVGSRGCRARGQATGQSIRDAGNDRKP